MTRYQLFVNAERLPKNWRGQRPNPRAEVKVSGGPLGGQVIGATETVENSVDPDFTKTLFIDTDASTHLPFSVTVFNDRNGDQLAQCFFEATEVTRSKGHSTMQEDSNGVRIYASVVESVRGTAQGMATLQFRGLDIKNIEPGLLGLGRSDPFFEISKKNSDYASGLSRWEAVYRSEHVLNHLNPLWHEFHLSLEELCHCDTEWPLKVTVFDYQENGRHRAIAAFETTLESLQKQVAIRGNADRVNAFEIYRETNNKTKTRGLIVVLKADVSLSI